MKSLSLESKVQPRLRSIELVCLITDRPHPTLPGTVLLDKGMPQPCEVKTALLSSREFEMVKRKLPEACVFPGGLSLFSCLCASGLRTCYSHIRSKFSRAVRTVLNGAGIYSIL